MCTKVVQMAMCSLVLFVLCDPGVMSELLRYSDTLQETKTVGWWDGTWVNELIGMVDVVTSISLLRITFGSLHCFFVALLSIYSYISLVGFLVVLLIYIYTLWWTNIAMEITIFNGKINYKWPFSTTILT